MSSALAPEVDRPRGLGDEWPLVHIVLLDDPETALCGEDMTNCEWADDEGDLCVVCGHLSGELSL